MDDVYYQVLLLDVIQLYGNSFDNVTHDKAGLIGKPFAREEGRVVLGEDFGEDDFYYNLDEMRNRLVQFYK